MQVYKGLEEHRGGRGCSGRRQMHTVALLGEGEATGRGNSRHRESTEACRYGVPRSWWRRRDATCCNKCKELLAFSRLEQRMLNCLPRHWPASYKEEGLIQDGSEQQQSALGEARQEGEGEETSLKR